MRKNQLIKLLESVEGNPEIKMWNGFVQDYTEINKTLVKIRLVKMTLEYYLESCKLEKCRDLNDWTYKLSEDEIINLSKSYKKVCKWDINYVVSNLDIESGKYKQKLVRIMQATTKGVSTWDRSGSISY